MSYQGHQLNFRMGLMVLTSKVSKMTSDCNIMNNPYKHKLQLSCKTESHEKFKYSFFAKSCYIWNKLYNSILEKSIISSKTGYVIPGEAKNSDLLASAALIKNIVADVLLEFQSSGDNKGWETNQFSSR